MKTTETKFLIGIDQEKLQSLQRDEVRLILAAMLDDLLAGRSLNSMTSRDFHTGVVSGLFMLFSSEWFPKLINDQRLCEMIEGFMVSTCQAFMPHRATIRGNDELH